MRQENSSLVKAGQTEEVLNLNTCIHL